MQVGTFVALLVSVAAGLIADNFQRIQWINDHFQPLEVYSILLAIAALAGIADVAMFIGVKEPPPAPRYDVNGEVMPDHRTQQPPLLASLREPLRDPAIRNFLIFVSLLMTGYGLQGAFLWLHALYYLGLSKTVTGIIVSGAPLLGMSCGMTFWSKVIKRYGTRPVMRMCSVGLVFVPIGWITAQPGEWTGIALMTFLSGFLAGAIELSNQNLVTGLSPHVPRATMAALFSIAGGLSFGLASLLGGKLAEFLYGMRQPFMGMTIINYHVLFLCSMLVRIINATIVAPRLRESSGGGGRQQGPGAGETSLALDRRKIRDRLSELKDQLEAVQRDGDQRRTGRRDQLRVALVGYTNAGKSSLMRALTGSEVLVEDKLFATLDTTVRALQPETRPRVLVSDTVGFIKQLPHDLVASFRSTLAEALEASLLLYVVDASDPTHEAQLEVSRGVLREIGADSVPSRLVLNKMDRVDAETRAALVEKHPDAILLSAHAPGDVAALRDTIIAYFEASMVEDVLVLPYARQGLIGEIYESARVLSEAHDETGRVLTLRALPAAIARLRRSLSAP